jgi:glucosamine--fructose-6-phosphate aminotransferase (isomerizing)
MCGIIGYCGRNEVLPILLDSLEKLEYRGYDSMGVASVFEGKIQLYKSKGRISEVKEQITPIRGKTGIGHTRWATHGVPSNENAHPHLSKSGKFAVVHNGIIENYNELKRFLAPRYFEFKSDTDTEVIAHLIEYYYHGDAKSAIIKAVQRLKGSYAITVLCENEPDCLYAIRQDSPLVLAEKDGSFAASDMTALIEYTRDFILLGEREIAELKKDKINIYNFNLEPQEKKLFHAEWDSTSTQKEGYAHFMLKEIFQQPKAVKETISSVQANLDRIPLPQKIQRICFVACGSAYHAAFAAKYFIEQFLRIPVSCDMASEFRYKNPIIEEGTLCIAVSQSGETADTIAAICEAKKQCPVLSFVNVLGSRVEQVSDFVLYTIAGPEIAVATTKGYTSQVAALIAFALELLQKKAEQGNDEQLLKMVAEQKAELSLLSLEIQEILDSKEIFQQLSSRLYISSHAFFIGRGIDYAIAMEGALKLKEISYIHAQSYPAGELKHGTISLIEEGSLVVAISTQSGLLMEKTINNIREVQSRGGKVLAITCFDDVAAVSEYNIRIKSGQNAPILAAVALQLFAYYVAAGRGCDIDKPRHLAKSVTVE